MLLAQKADKKGERNQAGYCFGDDGEVFDDRSFAGFAEAWGL